jgi:RNA polymerase sigma-70 factor (ECF subfamily)
MTNRDLIQAARVGHSASMRLLYDRHKERVYAVTRRLLDDDALAQERARETWLRAFRDLDALKDGESFSSWLHHIAIETALRPAPSRKPRREDKAVGLERALKALPVRMRQVLVLHDIEGLTHPEIARLLGIDVCASTLQLCRARSALRERVHPNPPRSPETRAREPALRGG